MPHVLGFTPPKRCTRHNSPYVSPLNCTSLGGNDSLEKGFLIMIKSFDELSIGREVILKFDCRKLKVAYKYLYSQKNLVLLGDNDTDFTMRLDIDDFNRYCVMPKKLFSEGDVVLFGQSIDSAKVILEDVYDIGRQDIPVSNLNSVESIEDYMEECGISFGIAVKEQLERNKYYYMFSKKESYVVVGNLRSEVKSNV